MLVRNVLLLHRYPCTTNNGSVLSEKSKARDGRIENVHSLQRKEEKCDILVIRVDMVLPEGHITLYLPLNSIFLYCQM